MLALTTAIDVDRTGRRYGENVDPHENVGPLNARDAGPDRNPVLEAATTWLVNSSGCVAQPR